MVNLNIENNKNESDNYSDIINLDYMSTQVVSIKLVKRIAKTFYKHFKDNKVDKIVTIETGGVSPAIYLAEKFDVDVLILKKEISLGQESNYKAEAINFTKQKKYTLNCSKESLNRGENVLYIGDLLVNGQMLLGAKSIVEQAGATLVGAGFIYEKENMLGREILNSIEIDNISLLRIE